MREWEEVALRTLNCQAETIRSTSHLQENTDVGYILKQSFVDVIVAQVTEERERARERKWTG